MNKPCPFCGSKRSRIVSYDGDVWRTCLKCGSSTAACRSEKRATAAWNNRAEKETTKVEGWK